MKLRANLLILLLLILLSSSLPALAENFYIAPANNQDGPRGSDSTGDGSEAKPWASLEKIDSKIDDGTIKCGDTVFARGGKYNKLNDYLEIRKPCSKENKLIIRNAPGETPIFNTNGKDRYGIQAVWLWDAEYIVLDGLHFSPEGSTDANRLIRIHGNHNEVKNCLLEGGSDPTPDEGIDGEYDVDYNMNRIIEIEGTGSYNYIHHNTIRKVGSTKHPYNSGYLFQINGQATYNRIAFNQISEGYHDCGLIYGDYNEYIGNIASPAVGYAPATQPESDRTLIERNKITGVDWNVGYVKAGIFLKGTNSVVRNNIVWHDPKVIEPNPNFKTLGDTAIAVYIGVSNKIYNNVFHGVDRGGLKIVYEGLHQNNSWLNNVFAANSQNNPYCIEREIYDMDKTRDYWNATDGNTFRNSFVMRFQNGAWEDDGVSVHRLTDRCSPEQDKPVSWMEANYASWSDNLYSSAGCPGLDPIFKNAAAGDFSLRSDSCLRDKGRWLTFVAQSDDGADNTLRVDDAAYFWFSKFDNKGDQIIIDGDPKKIRSITAIDLQNNTLSLDSPVSRTPGSSKIYLYKSFIDPNTVLFFGPAPDIGAFEYPSVGPNPPKDLKLLDQNT